MTISKQIRELSKKGFKPRDIAKELNIKVGYVYSVRSKDKVKKKKIPRVRIIVTKPTLWERIVGWFK